MRITQKGQVTIPKSVREKAGLSAGSEVEFDVEGDVITLKKVEARQKPGMSRGEKIVAAVRGTRSVNKELSTDQIMKLLRGDD